MDVSFQKGKNTTDEWYTPKWIVDALGKFDLDPCAPKERLWETATHYYTKEDDGLVQPWFGRVWANPPYSRKLIEPFIRKMAEHGNGIALVFNRMDIKMWHDVIFPTVDAMLIMRGRIRFYRPDGVMGDSGGCGSVLLAWGEENVEALRNCNIEGKFIKLCESD